MSRRGDGILKNAVDLEDNNQVTTKAFLKCVVERERNGTYSSLGVSGMDGSLLYKYFEWSPSPGPSSDRQNSISKRTAQLRCADRGGDVW